jgi:glutamyl-tRNA synthetase
LEVSVVRVRFAPAPTGALHIGGARTALFNWLYARHNEGKFILRIEDTDITRSTKESTQGILDSLKWLGLNWDEGPFFQSERRHLYERYAKHLLEKGYAYPCYCSPEELDKRRKAALKNGGAMIYDGRCRNLSLSERRRREALGCTPVIRFRVPPGKTIVFDLIRGKIEFDNALIGDFIIIKSDGLPTYNFAVVVDDFEMRITHVIRGDDHLSNTPKQILLYEALEFPLPNFAHLPMIWGPDKTRLSKRHGATSIDFYRRKGYLPECILNYLALLGWGTESSQQIFTREELIEKFSLDRVSKNPSIYDPEKLAWMNGEYIRMTDVSRLVELCIPFLKKLGYNKENGWLREIVALFQPRIKYIAEILSKADFFFMDEVQFTKEGKEILMKKEAKQNLSAAKGCLSSLQIFSEEEIEKALRDLATNLGIKAAKLFHPLRVALTGRTESPGIFEIISLLGKERVLKRIESALEEGER